MPNSSTLVQAFGAAFCAILCALSGMGGGSMMIGARTAAWAESGFDFSKYAGFSDAVLFWDAIHNDGIGKPHNPNRTSSIKDLVGNNDAVVDFVDPNVNIDILNDRVDLKSGAFLNCETDFNLTELLKSDFSVEIVFEDTSNEFIDSVWFDIGSASSSVRGLRTGGFENIKAPEAFGTVEYRINSYKIVNLGTRSRGLSHCFTSIQNSASNTSKVFLDGVFVGVVGGGSTMTGFIDRIRIARTAYSTAMLTKPMRLMRFGIINGLLTESELAANYAIDKARFGLT